MVKAKVVEVQLSLSDSFLPWTCSRLQAKFLSDGSNLVVVGCLHWWLEADKEAEEDVVHKADDCDDSSSLHCRILKRISKIFANDHGGTFLEKTMRTPPPSTCDKTLYTGLLLPTFGEGTDLFYVCGPLRARGSFVTFWGGGRGGSSWSFLGKTLKLDSYFILSKLLF